MQPPTESSNLPQWVGWFGLVWFYTESSVAQPGLKLIMQPRITAPDLPSSTSGVLGLQAYIISSSAASNPGLCACLPVTVPTELHPQLLQSAL